MNPKLKAHAATLVLTLAGAAMIYWFKAIADASIAFEQGTFKTNRPIIGVLTWFWFAFSAYLVAWATVGGFSRFRRQPGHKSDWVQLFIIFAFAIAFRYVMTPSVPIQEIDLYRYIWDGAVVSNQLDPYQFGPKTVYQAATQEPLATQRKGLEKYTAIVEQRPGLKRVLEITHFGEYTSPYPPVSQAIFGLAVATVKPNADARQYVVAMKTALVIFDLMTGFIVVLLLYHVGMNPSLSLGYLWCPLVLKEIANGGHLDSIATFFAVLAVYFTTRALWMRPTVVDETTVDEAEEPFDDTGLPPMSIITSAASALALAAAFSAKVFPIVLAPIWFVILARRTGIRSVFSMLLFLVAAYTMSLPMLNHLKIAQDLKIVPPASADKDAAADSSGIEAFSKYWEMNDFLFMLAVENIKPAKSGEIDKTSTPWFAVTNNDFRNQVVDRTRGFFEDENDPNRVQHQPSHFAFFTTRALSLGIFLSIGVWACFLLLFKPSRIHWLEMAFLATAWFWLLSPTQNPWYWTWSMPLLVFSRGRIWVFLSGTLLAYYLRFWLEYHFTGVDVMGYWKTEHGDSFVQYVLFPFADQYAYQGTRFFDMYVPVLEFGPWFFLLFVCAAVGLLTRRGTK